MKLTILHSNWIDVVNKARTTVNKQHREDYKEPTSFTKTRLLISEHSPIRLIRVQWLWEGLKYWLSTEFSRHHVGWEKWISSQRDDRTGIDRDDKPQASLVNMEVEANAQALINVARVRLCSNAHPEARAKMEELKRELYKVEPELADAMQRNCVYRCGCPEFKDCGWFTWFVERNKGLNITDIISRYNAANEEFYYDNQK